MGVEGMTTEQLLAEVRNAIRAVLVGGQSYKIGTRELTRANLSELKALKTDLEQEISASGGDGGLLDNTYVAVFGGR